MESNNDHFRIVDQKSEQYDFRELLNEHRKSNKFTDIELQIGDKHFPAHRTVLSLYSPVLEVAISDQWSITKICPISDEYVDVEIVEDLLSFLYTGVVKLTPDNAHSICMAAHFLQIPTLLEPSVDYLYKLINVENAPKLFASSLQLDQIRNKCLRLIIANYEKVFQDPEVMKFSSESFKCLISGLNERFLGTSLREHTFDCIVRWTENNPSERLEHLPILLEDIPLVELPVEFLEQTVSTHPLVKESVSCAEILSNAIANNETSWKTKDNIVVVGRYKTEEKLSMFCYDLHAGLWKQLPKLDESEHIIRATVVDRRDIIVASSSASGVTKIDMLDWITQTWRRLPTMPYRLHYYSIATLNGHLYIAGNETNNKHGYDTAVASYSFESKQWRCSQFSDRQRFVSCLIPYENHLYAIGWDFFEKYDPEEDRWTALARQDTDSCSLTATLQKGKIYLCSGRSFEVYDPETDSWTSLPAPVVGMTSLVSVNDKLLGFDGHLVTGQSYNDLIYEFHLDTQQWTEFGKLPAEFETFCCVAGAFH